MSRCQPYFPSSVGRPSTVIMSLGKVISAELSPSLPAYLLCDLGKVISPL